MGKLRLDSKDFYVVPAWVVSKDGLNLKGLEKDVFSIIYGFTKDGRSEFYGSLEYLSEWTNSTVQGVLKCLSKLQEKRLLSKREEYTQGNIKRVYYKATPHYTTKQSLMDDSTEFNGTIKQSLMDTTKQSLDNNIVTYKIDNKEITPLQFINSSDYSEPLKEAFREYIKMRKTIRKALTLRGLEAKINKLQQFSGGDENYMVDCLLQSVEHSWEDVYRLKNRNQEVKNSSFNLDELEDIGIHPSMQ